MSFSRAIISTVCVSTQGQKKCWAASSLAYLWHPECIVVHTFVCSLCGSRKYGSNGHLYHDCCSVADILNKVMTGGGVRSCAGL